MGTTRKFNGFTLIEVMIVIVVIAILATLVAVSYGKAQQQAADTQKRDAFDKFADALMTWSVQHRGSMPYGGKNTGGPTYDSANEVCTNPGALAVNGWQDYNYRASGYTCTLGDMLVNSGYLPAALFTNLPPNVLSSTNGNFMAFTCPTDTTKIILMAAQEAPSAKDTTAFDANYTACFGSTAPAGYDSLSTMHTTNDMEVSKIMTFTK